MCRSTRLDSTRLDSTTSVTASAGHSKSTELDSGFVRAYGLEPEEQNIIRNCVLQAARRDPRKAQPLVDEWITDPQIQRQTAEAIESLLDRYSLTPAD